MRGNDKQSLRRIARTRRRLKHRVDNRRRRQRQRRRRRRRRRQRQRRLRHLESVFKYIFVVSMWVQLQLSDVILGPEARGLNSAEIYC